MRAITTRQLERTLNRHYLGGKWVLARSEVVRERQTWTFMNMAGRMVGIIDHGTHLELHDSQNPNDSPENPSLRLSKGKKIKPL